ncbi:hypothetical protein [Thermochromatium tepidum]|uniref:Uncharacterized protein n=1 Tax=Thermochromatium tepidum ATCC 43061 TaxID=316276 RepID=A0A6I6E1G7_THETI|nr:hypothetical protein [Thermochromatium tepidum]QGU33791.1 hypothetical protein E6P07_12890 [Thermochromatium tepidum ATCC 43061]
MFIGVLPERAHLFQPEPRSEVAVNDAAAWRLNPAHRHIYDKLGIALAAGLRAAPCGVDPRAYGLAPDDWVFVKPIVNLAGMALQAHAVRAEAVPNDPGLFWCERLEGEHTSTDCLVRAGEVVWLAHTSASERKDHARPIYWEVGVERPELDGYVRDWVGRHLTGYTGLCNLELIGGRPIEAHLRGSNGFFELYGPGFVPAWVALMDNEPFAPPPPVPGGLVISVFGTAPLTEAQQALIASAGATPRPDLHTPDRVALILCPDKARGLELIARLDPFAA